MNAVVFNTLAYAKRLENSGVPPKQAEVQAEALAEIIEDKLATKNDITDLRRDMHEMETRLIHLIDKLNYKLTLRMGSMMVLAVSILAALIKL